MKSNIKNFNEFSDEEINESVEANVYADDMAMFDKRKEVNNAEDFVFYPCIPITVKKLNGEIEGDNRTWAEVVFSNGDRLEYNYRYDQPAVYEAKLEVDGNVKEFDGRDILEYMGPSGPFTGMIKWYRDYKEGKIKL